LETLFALISQKMLKRYRKSR